MQTPNTKTPHKLPSKKLSGFTLVELIVVITILVILGTIAFLQLGGFAGSERDSSRITGLSNLKTGLDMFQIKSGTYPLPENPVSIIASGETNIIGYQGFAKDQIGSMAKLSPGGTLDPLDPSMYTTYSVSTNQSKMQLMTFLEDGSNVTAFAPNALTSDSLISEASANSTSDYSKRYPKTLSDTLGILLSIASGTIINQPVQESGSGVDIVLTNTEYLAVFSKSDSVSGTGNKLFTSIYNRNTELLNNKSLASLDSSLVGYWDMETTTSTGILKDLSRKGNDGVGSGGVVIGGEAGKNGKATLFSGILGQNISIPNNVVFNVGANDNFTVLILAKTPLTQIYASGSYHYNCLLEKWGGEGYPFTVRIKDQKDITGYDLNSVGKPGKMITARYDKINNPGVYSNKNISDDIFHNLVFKKDQQQISNYIDGLKDSENIDTTTGHTVSTSPLVMGTCINGGLPYSGLIDEVRIYNRALSDSEVLSLYNATK